MAWAVAALLATIMVAPGAASAASSPPDQVQLQALGFADDTLTGQSVSAEYFLPGQGDYALASQGSSLDLVIGGSDLLDPTTSAITVLWNGVPIADQRAPAGDAPQTWQLPLQASQIDPAANRLQIQGVLHLRGETCGDDQNPARHITIYRQTGLHLAYADNSRHPVPLTPDLARFPWPFLQPASVTPPPVTFVLPAQPDAADLTAAASIAAKLGQDGGSKPLAVQEVTDGAANGAAADANLIYVGKSGELPGLANFTDLPKMPDSGVLYEAPSPLNAGRLALVVTGATDDALAKAAGAITSTLAAAVLRGDSAIVNAVRLPSAASSPRQASQALSAADTTVTGIGDHTLAFKFSVPGAVPRQGLPLTLAIAHSPLLDGARSTLGVAVDGSSVTSLALKNLDPVHGSASIAVPAAALHPGENTLDLTFSLSLPDATGPGCTAPPVQQAWAVLQAASSVAVPDQLTPPQAVTLADFPYPFSGAGGLDHTLLVLPDQPMDLAPVLQLAAALGRATAGDSVRLAAQPLAAFNPGSTDANVILWGTPDQDPMLRQMGGYLPLEVSVAGAATFAFGAGVQVDLRSQGQLGIVQETPSPWAPGREVLVVSGTAPDALPLAAQALSHPALTGNLALAGQPAPRATDAAGAAQAASTVTSYTIRPRQVPPAAKVLPPVAAVAAGGVILLALAITGGLVHRAFLTGRDE